MYSQEVCQLVLSKVRNLFKKSDSESTALDYHELTQVKIYLKCVNGRDQGGDVELPSGQQQYICLDWSCGWAMAVSRDIELMWRRKTIKIIKKIHRNGLAPDLINCKFESGRVSSLLCTTRLAVMYRMWYSMKCYFTTTRQS